ncbi:MAG: methyltransferase [Alphaproteobacteria bacterium]|nr:methyltransferase [Alphaproteobacteria bacterium]
MTQPAVQAAARPTIETILHYLVDTGEAPVFKQSDNTVDTVFTVGVREDKRVTVHNGRLHEGKLSLDVEGFVLAKQTVKIDFFDDEQVRKIYTPGVERLVCQYTGASRAIAYDYTRRSNVPETKAKYRTREPVPAPHSDYTDISAAQRLRDVLGDAAEAQMKKRFAIVNVWRSIAGTIEEWPLAVCDARSIDDSLMHTFVRETTHTNEPSFEYSRMSQTRHSSFDPNHCWYYFPSMTRDEALLFKNYDSATDGRARYCLHSAIEDPDGQASPAPRESMESRVFAFFD